MIQKCSTEQIKFSVLSKRGVRFGDTHILSNWSFLCNLHEHFVEKSSLDFCSRHKTGCFLSFHNPNKQCSSNNRVLNISLSLRKTPPLESLMLLSSQQTVPRGQANVRLTTRWPSCFRWLEFQPCCLALTAKWIISRHVSHTTSHYPHRFASTGVLTGEKVHWSNKSDNCKSCLDAYFYRIVPFAGHFANTVKKVQIHA